MTKKRRPSLLRQTVELPWDDAHRYPSFKKQIYSEMPTISIEQAKPGYDVIIVGSGAGGGQMAYTLTLAGLKCVMLEAGRSYDPVTETPMFQRADQAPWAGALDA